MIYVSEVEDERLDEVGRSGSQLQATQEVLNKHRGPWFDDEKLVVSRRHQ